MTLGLNTSENASEESAALQAQGVVVGYGAAPPILDGVDLKIFDSELTVIVGPNACGKSTLLRTLARVLSKRGGKVLLDGAEITSLPPRQVARRLGLLPQSPQAPEDIVVADLVARGRYPHQGLLRQWSQADEEAIAQAMRAAGVNALAERPVRELSGGQRQRVWIAMALAQETSILLLDEPTTYLDLAHQLEVLDLAADLHQDGHTVVAVLHDLGLAFRYATHLVVMKSGQIIAQGKPKQIVTSALIEQVFQVPCQIIADPQTGSPLVVPQRRAARRAGNNL